MEKKNKTKEDKLFSLIDRVINPDYIETKNKETDERGKDEEKSRGKDLRLNETFKDYY